MNDRLLGEIRCMVLYEENLPSRPNQEKNQGHASDDVITGLYRKQAHSVRPILILTQARADPLSGPGTSGCAPASRELHRIMTRRQGRRRDEFSGDPATPRDGPPDGRESAAAAL